MIPPVASLRPVASAGVIDPAAKSANSWHPYIFITEANLIGRRGRMGLLGSAREGISFVFIFKGMSQEPFVLDS